MKTIITISIVLLFASCESADQKQLRINYENAKARSLELKLKDDSARSSRVKQEQYIILKRI
jgi:hypothetical protein